MSEANIMETEYPTTISEGKKYNYDYWKNKPVRDFDEESLVSKKIEKKIKIDKYELPDEFKFISVDMNDNTLMKKIELFLAKNYVKDHSNKFRLNYTPEFIRWSLGKNGFIIAIVTNDKKNNICGTIATRFNNVSVFEKSDTFSVVNFLCCHKKYKESSMAQVLIDKITKIIIKKGITQACFTFEKVIPSPSTIIRYYHRILNYKKTYDMKFTTTGDGSEKTNKKFMIKGKIPDNYKNATEKHTQKIMKMFEQYVKKCDVHCCYTLEDFNWMLINNFVKCYLVVENNKIMDFVSYYLLESVSDDGMINAGYLYLYSCNNINENAMIDDLLKICTYNKLDVLIITDTLNMKNVLKSKEYKLDENSNNEDNSKLYDNNFIKATGGLKFNFFNWTCPIFKPSQICWNTL